MIYSGFYFRWRKPEAANARDVRAAPYDALKRYHFPWQRLPVVHSHFSGGCGGFRCSNRKLLAALNAQRNRSLSGACARHSLAPLAGSRSRKSSQDCNLIKMFLLISLHCVGSGVARRLLDRWRYRRNKVKHIQRNKRDDMKQLRERAANVLTSITMPGRKQTERAECVVACRQRRRRQRSFRFCPIV